ncbi:MAG TPA: peptidoglycan DD-metalloendopeptidase family protein [Thermoanaerobaculia bacterium]|nr:peptidoglycan DD-metalloendopeptidase family protein [Thermoanaerobaculia bacterium]
MNLELAIHLREQTLAEEVAADLENRSVQLTTEMTDLTARVAQQKRALSQRLAVLYRLGNLSYLRIILGLNAGQNPLEAASMLSYLVRRDARLVDSYRVSQRKLDSDRSMLTSHRARITQMQEKIAESRRNVEARKRQKETLLVSLRSQSTSSVLKIAELQEKEQRLQRLFNLLYAHNSGDAIHREKVTSFKGALQWPLMGKLIEGFGRQRNSKFATFTQSNGIKIAAAPGADAHAVFNGTVLFSQWFRGYGNLLIVDHGDRVFSLYGNIRGATVHVGESVVAGQVIGFVAENEEGGDSYLYFEVREDNRPSDPRSWLR